MTISEVAVIIASVVVIITFFGILLADKRTRESNELTRMELNSRLRPWIKIGDITQEFVQFENGDTISWSKYTDNVSKHPTPKIVIYGGHIENVGLIPTMGAKLFSIEQENQFTKKDLVGKTQKAKEFVLMPSEKIHISSEVKYNMMIITDKNPYYIGYRIDYLVNKNKVETVGKIWSLRKNLTRIDEYWVT